MVLVACDSKIIQRHPGFDIFECFNIRIDMQLRRCIGRALKLHIAHELQLVFIDMRINNFMVGHARLFSCDLGHQFEKRKDLYLIEILAKGHIAGALI